MKATFHRVTVEDSPEPEGRYNTDPSSGAGRLCGPKGNYVWIVLNLFVNAWQRKLASPHQHHMKAKQIYAFQVATVCDCSLSTEQPRLLLSYVFAVIKELLL